MESAAIPILPPAGLVEAPHQPVARPLGRRIRIAAAVVAVAVVALGMAYLRTWPPIDTVMSGSMAPTINTGDLVLVGKLRHAPHIGDVVVVGVPDDARKRYGYPPEVIHRVVRVARGRVQTKGDARQTADPFTVPAQSVDAHVVLVVPAVGRLFAFLGSPLGLLWLGAGAVLLIGMPLVEQRRADQERERDSLAALHAELQTISSELAELRRQKQEAEEQLAASAAERSRGEGIVREVHRFVRMRRFR